MQQPVAIASGVNPLCSITVGDFVHGFAFKNLTELDAGIAAFKNEVAAARKLIPLAVLSPGCHPEPVEGPRRSPAKTSREAQPDKTAAFACSTCGKKFGADNAWYRKHIAGCGGAPSSVATDTGFIAIINLKPADMAAVKDEVDPSHISFIMGDPDASRILGASDVILYRFEKAEWFTVANNTLKKNKIHVAHDLDGVIAIAKKLTR